MATAKTETFKSQIVNIENGEVTEVVLTAEEKSERELTAQSNQADREAMATARASALAKLAALGLTENEIAAL
jgi:DNA-binding NarL/FixJ family response regulator